MASRIPVSSMALVGRAGGMVSVGDESGLWIRGWKEDIWV